MSGTGPQIRGRGGHAYQALLGLASTNLGVPVANLTVAKRRRSRAAARPSPTASWSAASSSTSTIAGTRRARTRASAPAKPVSQYTLVGRRTVPPDRHPGQGDRHLHLRPQHPVPGMLHGRVVRPRGQGAYRYRRARSSSRRRDLDRAHPGRPGRPEGQLPRRRRAARVRRDPGGGAAEGRPGRTNPILPGTGNLFKQMRRTREPARP